jgi:dipeptidyl aminopeptidase/acylaminoacyl peptidase
MDGVWHKSSDVNSFDAIYVIPSDGDAPLQVTSANDTVGRGSIAFTPDGKRIAFFSGNAIRTIPVEGGKSEILLSGVNFDHKSRLAWSSDGSRIAYNHNGKVWLTDLSTGEKTDLKTGLPENYYVEDFDWSPDGQKITFIASTGEGYEFFLISNFMNF